MRHIIIGSLLLLGLVGFTIMIGAFGGLEQDTISLTTGIKWTAIGLGMMAAGGLGAGKIQEVSK